ncbi:Zn-dependent hydrolase [Photobacterium makurazakiensis]|uniref:Zn-dependent hydrolase n=1 Tax=Photobacterium makurazakiensis TaxID=2910234 RepID=UPI003D12D76D
MDDYSFSIASFLEDMASFSTTTDGVTRFPCTLESLQAREYLVTTMNRLGLEAYVDHVGNVRGRRQGVKNQDKAVVFGSHYDSVRNAGKYDGLAGIACSLKMIDDLNRRQVQTEFPIEVIALEAEEGCDFKSPFIGSKAVTGQFTLDDLKQLKNTEGVDYFTACQQNGLSPEVIATQQYHAGNTAAFIELHIEQAAKLDNIGISLGIVSAISALRRVRLSFYGQANHAGATPMDQRRDAMVAAAGFIHQIPALLESHTTDSATITAGRITCLPNRANIIPAIAHLEIDVRDVSDSELDALHHQIICYCESLAEKEGLRFETEIMGEGPAVAMDDVLQLQLGAAAEQAGHQAVPIHSGAGHDAGIFAAVCPVGMVFLPSEKGFSHNPQEHTANEHLEAGAEVLTQFVINMEDQ